MSISSRSGTCSAGTARRRSGSRAISSPSAHLHLRTGELLAEALVDAVAEGQVGDAGRLRSRRSGSSQWWGSRLASGVAMITVAPAGTVTSPILRSSVATRLTPIWMIDRKRSSSSIAVSSSSGSARSLASSAGFSSRTNVLRRQHVGGGLVARAEQHQGHVDELVVGQVEQARDHVVARRGPLGRDQLLG